MRFNHEVRSIRMKNKRNNCLSIEEEPHTMCTPLHGQRNNDDRHF